MVRFKHRYLAGELTFEHTSDMYDGINGSILYHCIYQAIEYYYGQYGISLVMNTLQIKYFNKETKLFILRCSREHHKMVWSVLTLLNSININNHKRRKKNNHQYIPQIQDNNDHKIKCSICVIHVAGTIRSCQKHLITYLQQQLLEKSQQLLKQHMMLEIQQLKH